MNLPRRQFLISLPLLAVPVHARADNEGKGGDRGGNGKGNGGGNGKGNGGGNGVGNGGGNGVGNGVGNRAGSSPNSASNKNRSLDHDKAREAVQRGDVIALNEALGIVEENIEGRVIDIDLKRTLFGYVYTFKVKARSGRIATVRMNARNGRLFTR
ncbi:MAG: hypothetical protein LJE67_01025 [Salaquimonas sp.]|nr:hypothetical protein [Salaquimonas sp.]